MTGQLLAWMEQEGIPGVPKNGYPANSLLDITALDRPTSPESDYCLGQLAEAIEQVMQVIRGQRSALRSPSRIQCLL